MKGSRIGRLLAAFALVLLFYFLFRSLSENYEKLAQFNFNLQYLPLTASFMALFFTLLFNPWAWLLIMEEMGETMDYRQSYTILYISQLGKYLPGRLWSYISQVYLAKKEGLSGEKTLIASVLFQVMSSLMSLYVFALSFIFWRDASLTVRAAVLFLSTLATFIILRGNFAETAVDLVVNRLFKRNLKIRLRRKPVVKATLILLSSWFAYAVAYYSFLRAFFPLDMHSAGIFTGIYAISWLIGYASLLTPGGLGIREGVQAYLLSFFLPLPLAIVISLACRLWITVGEIAVSLVAFYLIKRRRGE